MILYQLQRLFTGKWDKWMITHDSQQMGKKENMAYFKVLSHNFHGSAEENHATP
jgi:hypothetical protein